MKTQIFRKTKILLIAFLSVLLALCTFGYAKSFNLAKADQSSGTITTNFLPQSELEHLNVSNPIDALSFDDVSAVMTTNSLIVYSQNKYVSINGTTFTEIERFGNSILLSSESRLHKIQLDSLFSSTSFELNNDTQLSDEAISYFKVNGDYLITSYTTYLRIFTIDELGVQKIFDEQVLDMDKSDVAINQNNQIFYVASNGINMINLQQEPYQHVFLSSQKPTKMIANNNYIYYIDGNEIFRLSTAGGQSVPLSISDIDSDFELGKINTPIALSFKGENLLITDQNTIQEFAIQDDQLVFTGFAIAKGKTAYNRISDSATEIEKTNKNVAVLDDFKLTVYTKNNVSDLYARENYKNYLIEDLVEQGNDLSSFALGEQNALLLYNAKTSDSFVSVLDLTKTENALTKQTPISEATFIRDVCYQSGYYYLLCDDGSAPQDVYTQRIYKASANGQNLSLELIASFTNPLINLYTIFNVDTYGNVYLANKTTVAKLNKSTNSPVPSVVKSGLNNIIKMQSDLLGNLYILDESKIYSIQDDHTYSITGVKSFAFDFVDDNLYYLTDNSETIYSSTEFENVSIEDIKVSNDFYLTNPQGQTSAKDDLEFYTIKPNENAYKIESSKGFNVGDNFIYKQLCQGDETSEYVRICAIDYSGTTFYLLANRDDFVLVDQALALSSDKQKDLSVNNTTAYIATNVNAYYLPILTSNDTFALNDGGQKITLTKTTEIALKFKISFLGYDYYYAEFTDNGATKLGYIPCDFTTDVLTKDFTYQEFTTEKVKKTDVYSDSDMQQKVIKLEENTLVKILEKGENVCKIAYLVNDEYQIGYIYTSSIIDQSSVAVRNVIIILAVLTCLFSTSLYFILKKKRS